MCAVVLFLTGCAATDNATVQVTPIPTASCPWTYSGEFRYFEICATATPKVVTPVSTPLPSCSLNYLEKWHQLTSSRVKRLEDSTLIKGAQEFLQQRYPGIKEYLFPKQSIPFYGEPKIYEIPYPDDPASILVEYDIPLQSHGHIQTLLLRHDRTGWVELPPPPFQHTWVAFLISMCTGSSGNVMDGRSS